MNRYLKKAIHYFAGNIFNNILLIIFLPIFTHFMIPAEYAIYTNFLIFMSFANLVYLMGMQQSLFPYFHEETSNEYKYTLISSIFITVITFGLIFSSIILLNANKLSRLIVRDPGYDFLIPYIVVITFTGCIYVLTLSILNMMERSANYAVLGGVKNLILLCLFVYGSLSNQFTLRTVFLFMMISSGISALLALINMRIILKTFSNGRLEIFSFKILKPVLKFGLIMIPGTMAMLILRVIDRYMLTYLSAEGLHDVGIYSTGYRVGMIMQFLVTVFSLVFISYAMRIADRHEAKKLYRKIFNYFILFGGLLGVMIILFSNEFFRFFIDARYIEAVKVVFIGVISTFLHGVFNIINIGFYVKKRATDIAIAVISGAILNIVLNYILIPLYGIYGAGVASIISYIFIVLYNYFKLRAVFSVKYKLSYLVIVLVILLGVALLNFIIPFRWDYSIYKIVIVILLGFASIYLNKRQIIEQYHIIKSGE